MTRLARKGVLLRGGHYIKIDGRRIDINFAAIVYRCQACHSKLKKVDAGLKCVNDPSHLGLLHRDEVKRIETEQEENIKELEQFYTIKNGKVVIKE